ncbi:MAG: tRNA (adenine-N(6)-)-methyltransferase [Pseudomonadota bacterium]|nr:tRNA (adenine-N(6)-)-methyltransferase [Pseudomonadota bacterium]
MKKELDSGKLMYSKGNNDECYTPDYGVEPILKYIPKDATVWCPFDTQESQFVIQISKQNKVIRSHLESGQDFFDYEPEEWDMIVSNPPFTDKRKFFERALSFNKPFALIMTNTWLNDSAPKQLFKDKDLQLLMFDKRMKFVSPDGRDNDKITFSSSYYCWNFLPKQIIMEELDVPKKQSSQTICNPLTELLY